MATLPGDFCESSLRLGASPRVVANTLLTCEEGRAVSWRANSRPRPRDAPVMRYEAIIVIQKKVGRKLMSELQEILAD